MTDKIAEIAGKLTEVDRAMFENEKGFGIDGWCSSRGKESARKLEALGLFTSDVGGDDQYTLISYTPTPLGIAVRNHIRGDEG